MSEYIVDMSCSKYNSTTGSVSIGVSQIGEEVVRCRDCKHGYEVHWPASSGIPADYLNCHGELTETWNYYNDEPKDNPVPPDGYCFWGKVKEVGA